jgi:flagellar biosynthetic protein FlhB
VLVIYAFLALGDALYQRFAWHRRQRMTRRELKEEYKQQEGDPEFKARRKQVAFARVKKRMMAAVPQATVIVTNPTHYAVALRYESGMQAPVCVAKGVDALALRIRAVATEHDVPIVENPPLARALHATVQIDEEIPVEHYKAVAELIGYVMTLRRRVGGGRP